MSIVNGEPVSLEAGTTVADVVASTGTRAERARDRGGRQR